MSLSGAISTWVVPYVLYKLEHSADRVARGRRGDGGLALAIEQSRLEAGRAAARVANTAIATSLLDEDAQVNLAIELVRVRERARVASPH